MALSSERFQVILMFRKLFAARAEAEKVSVA